jgi:lipopolysaccharide export system protein LptA
MRLAPSLLAVLALAGMAGAQDGRPAAQPSPFGFGKLGDSKDPITVTSDTLEYDYRGNVVRYGGRVEVTQGNLKLVSDMLTITLDDAKRGGKPADEPGGTPPPAAPPVSSPRPKEDAGRVREIVAAGNVRIDQGPRWAVGGRAVFDQTQRTLVLTENPVLHDGPNQIAGDRVVVFLDEDRSVVEGGRQRVKAVLYPDQEPGGGKPAVAKSPGTGARRAAAGKPARQ